MTIQDVPIAIVGATVIDGCGGHPIQDGVILVERGRIETVGGPQTPIPPSAQRLSATGKYVIPGLLDANVHLVLDYFPVTLIQFADQYDKLAIEAAAIALRNGVTTVFDTWGPRSYLIRARRAINEGRADGARIFLAGNIVGLDGPISEDFFPLGRESLFEEFTDRTNALWQENVGRALMWATPPQLRQAIREHARSGIDFLRVAVSGHGAKVARYLQFSPRALRVIVDEAHGAGLTVQTHTTSVEAIELAMDTGVDLLQQVSTTGVQILPPDTIARLVSQAIPCGIVPNTEKAMTWYREKFLPGARARLAREAADVSERRLIAAGANLLMSTDGGIVSSNTSSSAFWRSFSPPADQDCSFILGEGHFHWLQAVEQKGMHPGDALAAATRNVARAYKVDKDLGTLETGKIADLVVLDKNPLESASHYRSIYMVMKDGKIVDRSLLPARRLLTAAA